MLPSAAVLVGMLMLGNLMRESGVVDRISKTAQNELLNIITIFLGVSVGATATGAVFLSPRTIYIIIIGLFAFAFGTFGGIVLGNVMCKLSKGKINPLIGSAGVSAVPMAAQSVAEGGTGGKPEELPADARNGTQCGGCNRFCGSGRYPACHVWRLNVI